MSARKSLGKRQDFHARVRGAGSVCVCGGGGVWFPVKSQFTCIGNGLYDNLILPLQKSCLCANI